MPESATPLVLVGYEIKPAACMKVIDNPSPDALAPADKVFGLNCWTFNEVRVHETKLHQPQR